jgi:hypothetical protein
MPKQCINRLEMLTVAARIMMFDPTSDVMKENETKTRFDDVKGNQMTMRYINRSYRH